MAIFPTFFFLSNIGQEIVFYDILKRKNAFLGYKNKKFKKSKNWHFSKGINPFAPGDFAEKSVLKLVEWVSGHCRAIKSYNLPQTGLQVVHFAAFCSRFKISASEVPACAETKISR